MALEVGDAAVDQVGRRPPPPARPPPAARSPARPGAGIAEEGGGVHHHPGDQAAGHRPVAIAAANGELEPPGGDPLQHGLDRQVGPDRAGGQVVQLDPDTDRGRPAWSAPATAATVVRSARASTRGVASTGTSPLPIAAAVSASVTVCPKAA
jgi:hypothetical protein